MEHVRLIVQLRGQKKPLLIEEGTVTPEGVREFTGDGDSWVLYPWHRISTVAKPSAQPSLTERKAQK